MPKFSFPCGLRAEANCLGGVPRKIVIKKVTSVVN